MFLNLLAPMPREMACPMVGRYVVEPEDARSKLSSSSSSFNPYGGASSFNNRGFSLPTNNLDGVDEAYDDLDDSSGPGSMRRRRHRGVTGRNGRLATAAVISKACPDDGAPPTAFSTLHVGCRDHRRMELGSKCRNSADVVTGKQKEKKKKKKKV